MREVLRVTADANSTEEWMTVHVSDADRESNGEAIKEAVARAIDDGESVIVEGS